MTVPVWPEELPRPERNTYGAQHQDPRKQRRSEAGPPGWLRRFSSAAKIVSLSVDLSRDEKAVFDNFHQVDAAMGSLPFWVPDPTTDGWGLLNHASAQILVAGGPHDGEPLLLGAVWLCSFGTQMPRETITGVRFRKTFELVVYP